MVYVGDTAEAFCKIAECDEAIGEEINIATGAEISIGELADNIIKIINPSAEIITDEDRLRPDKSEVMRLMGDSGKLTALTGFKAEKQLSDGLQDTINWFRERGLKGYKTDIYNV